jgi:hypothetical protein
MHLWRQLSPFLHRHGKIGDQPTVCPRGCHAGIDRAEQADDAGLLTLILSNPRHHACFARCR